MENRARRVIRDRYLLASHQLRTGYKKDIGKHKEAMLTILDVALGLAIIDPRCREIGAKHAQELAYLRVYATESGAKKEESLWYELDRYLDAWSDE